MNFTDIQKTIENTPISWNCISREDQHEIGCPHKSWTNEQLLGALISKKKFEASGLRGTHPNKHAERMCYETWKEKQKVRNG